MRSFSERPIKKWEDFPELGRSLGAGWLYRGQSSDSGRIKSSLERACLVSDVSLKVAPGIETQLARDFRRKYDGEDRDVVIADTLYCLALMQHHGAPTRLTDWTYSPFVAAYFALECAESECFVWCVNGEWCLRAARTVVPNIDERNVDAKRNDETWRKFYMRSHKFVFAENPSLLNRRLIIQQGVFLCPGDVSVPFTQNLKAMGGWNEARNVIKVRFVLDRGFRRQAMAELFRMNVSRATLFPGLDGFAQSLGHRMPFYESLARAHTGQPTPNKRLRRRVLTRRR
jgi:hypothetical protein